MRSLDALSAATALLLPSLTTLAFVAPLAAAVDPDCTLPPNTPDTAPLYSGYALKTGTNCKQFVYCQKGIVSSEDSCPPGLIYSGKVAEVGICNYPDQVKCADDEDGNSGGGSPAPRPAAADPDCELPPGAPDTAPLYTGFALKTGTWCKQYVYCDEGAIASWNSCPDNLVYSWGNCIQPSWSGACADHADADGSWPPGANDDASGNSGGDSDNTDTAGGDDAGAGGALATMTLTLGDATVAGSTPSPVPNPDSSVLAALMFGDGSAISGGFCGASMDDAKNKCQQPCEKSEDCCDPSEACFPAGSSCAGVDYSGPGHFYCGSSWCDAADTLPTGDCRNKACPGGTNEECPGNKKCFADVPCGASSDPVASFLSSNSAVAPANDNPNNYFCGTNMTNAEQLCLPCPSGLMKECSADFTHGCFINVDSCAGGNGGEGGGASPGNSGSAPGNSGSAPAPADPVSTLDDPVPAPEPTLPPWTNAPFNPSPTNKNKVVIGYYASWQWYDRNKLADPRKVDFSKYDRINYAFFQPDVHGNLFGTDEWADPQLLWGPYAYNAAEQVMSGPDANHFCSWDLPGRSGRKCNYHDTGNGIIEQAHSVGVEVWPSIGGWTLSDNFSGIAKSPERRETFAQQCIELIDAYGFDGIDIDWEYPGYEDHSGKPEDTENFTLLLAAVRAKLQARGNNRFGRPYGLTAALPCGPNHIEKIQVNKIKDILTEANLMSYDLHGAWDILTGINAPMFDQGWTDKTPRWSVHGCVNNYVDLGVPLSKLNMGLPFYGRSFMGATGMKQFHGGADDINYHLDEGSPQYFNIHKELGTGMTTYRHEKTQTQFAVFNSGGGVVSYDDPRAICDKVHYANERGMHGFLIWEISGDMIEAPNGEIATPLADAMNNKINDPGYNCAALRDDTAVPLPVGDLVWKLAPPEPETVDWSQYAGPNGNTGSANDFNGAQSPGASPGASPGTSPGSSPGTSGNPPGDSGNPSGKQSADCPLDFNGYYPTADCKGYVQCTGGAVEGGPQSCGKGLMFDIKITGCNWEEQVDVTGCGR